MTTSALPLAVPARPFGLVASLPNALLRRQRALTATGLLMLALMAPTFAALLADPRTLHGISVWMKPLKFQASLGLYLLTLAWFFGDLPERVRRGPVVRSLVAVAVAASLFEIAYIALQAGRGLASHFNVGDPFHATMYGLMGLGAVALTAVSPALAALLVRHRPRHLSTAFWLSVVIGLALTFVLGAGVGGVLSSMDGHWIGGVRSDAGGVPVVGWSRTGGDLRIAHFLGIHAMHALPAVGFAAGRLLAPTRAVAAVLAASLAYAALTAAMFAMALQGRPLLPL
jgi:hypothetical protein